MERYGVFPVVVSVVVVVLLLSYGAVSKSDGASWQAKSIRDQGCVVATSPAHAHCQGGAVMKSNCFSHQAMDRKGCGEICQSLPSC